VGALERVAGASAGFYAVTGETAMQTNMGPSKGVMVQSRQGEGMYVRGVFTCVCVRVCMCGQGQNERQSDVEEQLQGRKGRRVCRLEEDAMSSCQ
jgi:hypothetical protein